MQYWEIIADKLSAAGFSWGYCSARDSIGDTVAARLKMPSRVLGVVPRLDAVFGAPTFRRRIRGQTTNQEAVPQELNTFAQSGSGECPRN
jgi:hypothetical protein